MSIVRSVAAAVAVAACACAAPERGTLRPRLMFEIEAEIGLHAARDLTVDRLGHVYVFDYNDDVIRRFDSTGVLLVTFGGLGEEPGHFEHLMTIAAHGDSLLALDAGSVSVFDLAGNLRSRQSLADTVICDHPALHPDGRWAAWCIVKATAEQTLTYRGADGNELRQVASYALADVVPGVEPGGPFFIRRTQVRAYLYDFTPDGRLVWAVSDRLRLFTDRDGVHETLFEADATPVPFPADEIASLRERQASLAPPLFMNVPDNYQLIQHLVIDESGDLWVYVLSRERTGFLRLSASGREKGFYTLEAPFDPLAARLEAAGGRLYFMIPGPDATAIYSVELP
jgi:hypothetical protein